MALIRLQRYLAMAGVASRRHAEELIVAGSVRVNGRVIAELGSKVDPERDKVTVSGRRVQPEDKVYYLLNKPPETVSTMADPQGRTTIADLLPKGLGARLFPIGRLEWGAEGAILLTNDGDFAQALIHPTKRIEKTYHVKVRGIITEDKLEKLRAGVRLEDGKTPEATVGVVTTTGKHTWIEITLPESRPQQVPRMCEAIRHPVIKLIRVAFAGIGIEGVEPGALRELTVTEVTELRELVGIKKPGPIRHRGRHKRERERSR